MKGLVIPLDYFGSKKTGSVVDGGSAKCGVVLLLRMRSFAEDVALLKNLFPFIGFFLAIGLKDETSLSSFLETAFCLS